MTFQRCATPKYLVHGKLFYHLKEERDAEKIEKLA